MVRQVEGRHITSAIFCQISLGSKKGLVMSTAQWQGFTFSSHLKRYFQSFSMSPYPITSPYSWGKCKCKPSYLYGISYLQNTFSNWLLTKACLILDTPWQNWWHYGSNLSRHGCFAESWSIVKNYSWNIYYICVKHFYSVLFQTSTK